mgnify:CR=1 FL=1
MHFTLPVQAGEIRPSELDADVVESVDTRDLRASLSAPVEMSGVELLKFGETLTGRADGNPERSPKIFGERVETRRAAPKVTLW